MSATSYMNSFFYTAAPVLHRTVLYPCDQWTAGRLLVAIYMLFIPSPGAAGDVGAADAGVGLG